MPSSGGVTGQPASRTLEDPFPIKIRFRFFAYSMLSKIHSIRPVRTLRTSLRSEFAMGGGLLTQPMAFPQSNHATAPVPVIEHHSYFQLGDKRFLALPELEACLCSD